MGGRLARKGRPLGKARTRSLALMPMVGRCRHRRIVSYWYQNLYQ